MTENEDTVARIVGSGAPVPDEKDPEPGDGDLGYDEVHDFLAEMAARQGHPPDGSQNRPARPR